MSIGKLRADARHLLLASLSVLSVAIWLQVPVSHERVLSAVILDVGQGDSICLRTPSGKTMLVDGGGSTNPRSNAATARKVESFLRHEGINRIDVVVITHPHEDHIGGLAAVVKDFRVGMVLDPFVPCNTNCYRNLVSSIQAKRVRRTQAVRGQKIDFGDGVSASVLNPPKGLFRTDKGAYDANNSSVVLMLTYGQSHLLLMGDAGTKAEQSMVSAGKSLRSETIKIGHHGSTSATGESWLNAVGPRRAVISVGRSNIYHHPSPRVLNRLSARGIKVYRTDRDGAITVRMYRNRTTVDTFVKRRTHATTARSGF